MEEKEEEMLREYFKGATEEERAYSPAIKVNGGTTIYLAGVGATTDENGKSRGATSRRKFEPPSSEFAPIWPGRVVL